MNNDQVLENVTINLSDFALFMSVMKNPKAYQNTLSIILDEPNIQLKEVKVEQVILNKTGKRAIRLDAWAVSEDERQFNIEMENHSERDSVPKRARFYQGLIDTPILKSGRKTQYRQLPSTVIIFITQEDIFKKDRAMYTFVEKCKEIDDLEIDEIVTEVKESEEWEGIEMNILEIGIQEGERRGREQGIQAVVEVCKSLDVSKEETIVKIMEKFSISKDEAENNMQKYW